MDDTTLYNEEQVAVSIVTTIHQDGSFTTYVAPFGFNKIAVIKFGIKLTEQEARILFPTLTDKPYRA